MRIFLSWLLRLFFMVPVAIVCYAVASEGLRTTLPQAFAIKLHRLHLPFVQLLEGDEIGHRLDLASVMSLLLVVGVCMVAERLVEVIILHDIALAEARPHVHAERTRIFLVLLGVLLLFADSALFYIGVQKHAAAWGSGAGTSVPALLATIVYVSLLVTAAYVVVEAKHG